MGRPAPSLTSLGLVHKGIHYMERRTLHCSLLTTGKLISLGCGTPFWACARQPSSRPPRQGVAFWTVFGSLCLWRCGLGGLGSAGVVLGGVCRIGGSGFAWSILGLVVWVWVEFFYCRWFRVGVGVPSDDRTRASRCQALHVKGHGD